MKNKQATHIAMTNSYRVLMGEITMQHIINSGLGIFAHSLDEFDAMQSIQLIIRYFENIEMYEHCLNLQQYILRTFDEDGKYKNKCSCELPDVDYSNIRPLCKKCNSILVM